MNTANFCIRHRVATLLAVILIALFGSIYGTQLQMALMPDIEAPMAVVICYYNGATPDDMEQLVTRPLEGAIMSVSGVKEVSSTSADSVSQVQVTYEEGTNLDIAATKLREKFEALSLPEDATKPVIVNINVSDLMPTAMVALMGEDLGQLQTLAEDVVSPALERIDGVAQVTINGGVTQQIAVELDPTRCAGLGLSNSYVAQYLAGQNLLYPGGELQSGSQTLTVSTDAKFQSVQDVADTLIALPAGGTVRLSEVAQVRLEAEDSQTVAKMGQTPCVVLQISKQSSANEASVSDQVVEQMEKLGQEDPSIRYAFPYLASEYINLSVDAAFQNIIQGLILAALVVLLFLRRAGATLTIAVSMPVCILSVFVLMNVMGLTLNMMSLGGIAMGVGMIVDNSIVVLENIFRFSREGHGRMESCLEGTKEVTTSVVASTLTTMAVFVPLGVADGLAGMLFKDFCLTIASLIGASLVISLTLVPLLCYFMIDEEKLRRQEQKALKKKKGPVRQGMENLTQGLKRTYLGVLGFFVRHLKLGMLLSLGLTGLFALTLLSTKTVLLPDMDQGQLSVSMSLPIGSELEESTRVADLAAAVIEREVPELDEMYYIAQEESVTMMISLTSKTQRERSSFDIANHLRTALADIAGCEITVDASQSMGMLGGDDISVAITGDDYSTLSMIADDLTQQIQALPDAVDVKNSLSQQVPQVKVTLQREAAAQYGLTASAVGAAVRSELTGTTATTVTIDNKELDVVVRGDGTAGQSLDALRSMAVTTPYGGTVPLGSVAVVEQELAPQTIARDNQSRQVTVTGDTISGDTTAITMQIQEILDAYPMPKGYSAEIGGSYTEMMDSFQDLLLALVVALGLVYFVLAAQFESFTMPVIVMLILPVAFTGALFALPLTGRDLSMISLVAIIMLAGTVVNASIILVEYIKVRRRRGEDREQAILHACPLRVRPILMTNLTTILAMVPMALGIGETNEMMADMGITMISGMVISTAITLILTPVYYCVIDNLSHPLRRKKTKQQSPSLPAQSAGES